MIPSPPLSQNPIDTGIAPISLDSDTTTISRGTDRDCGQLSFSSKSPHPPLSRLAFPSQPIPVFASITYPDTHLPSSIQLWAIPPSPLSIAVGPTSMNQNNNSLTACSPLSTSTHDLLSTVASSSSSLEEANDSPPVTNLPLLVSSSHISPPRKVINYTLAWTVLSSTVPSLCDPVEYFRNEIGSDNTKRIDYLVEAIQDFIQSLRTFSGDEDNDVEDDDDDTGDDNDNTGDDSGDGPLGASSSDPILYLTNLSRGYTIIRY
ncbi:hypothetical protein NA56DRAFT_663427 [Hyaloscypha hepaticicola]|uniref:Uncharacterized protein n=1 Tax=Hyaloscypha hepaticicola TaxID=2082293 RepID=A0A2J6PPG7_9HELO|nr:hypothetical protein NA56DRAFT_663427 [Hyaloscypha hepaticicola]